MSNTINNDSNPSQSLQGKQLEGGWVVSQIIEPSVQGTGGSFCTQYRVERDGQSAFMKALDFSRIHHTGQDWTKELERCLQEYHFEKDLYEKCAGSRMSRVVVPLAHGSVNSGVPSLFPDVPYIIFEIASEGDLRKARMDRGEVDAAWALAMLYNAALGVFQLHQAEIVHQDLKPSNVLVFDGDLAKISDLGRASDKNKPFYWDEYIFAGDVNYAPIEVHFGVSASSFEHRYAFDLYMLGSLVFFHFLGVPLNGILNAKCRSKGVDFRGMGFHTALPFLESAFYECLGDLRDSVSDRVPVLAEDILLLCEELCFPDPERRGPKGRRGKPSAIDAQRYVGKFSTLSRKASFSS